MDPQLLARFQVLYRLQTQHPAEFDYFRSLGEVLHHSGYVSLWLKAPLLIDHSYRSATVFCSLHTPSDDPRFLLGETSQTAYTLFGRFGGLQFLFSKFDRTVTVMGASLPLFAETLPDAIAYLVKQGYKYVPCEELVEIADPEWPNERWFNVLFDY